jgi:8-oxo-dGTP pyrophosphatase MutT (NUDIX family)
MSWHPSDRLFASLAGGQSATGEPLAQDLPHACSYCGSTEFEAPVDTGRGATATCSQCGGSMSSWGGQWTPELIGDPSNHPSPKVDPRSGAGFGQNYLVHPEGFDMMPPKEAFSIFEVTAGERPTVVHDPEDHDVASPKYRYRQTVQTSTGYEDQDREIKGPLYHGGRANLRPGDHLTVGRKPNSWGDEGTKSTHNYFTSDMDVASSYAQELGRKGRIYEVEPTGDFKKDYGPNDYKTKHPLRVVREVSREEWPTWAKQAASVGSAEFHFQHEEADTGGTKFPRRVDITAHHPETGEEAGSARYYPPKRKGGPISIDEVQGHVPGAASALLNEIESRHPTSMTKFLYEVKRNNNNPDVTGHAHERAGKPSDWDTHYPNLSPTVYRGASIRLPERSARVVNSSSSKEDHLEELHDAISQGSALGPHWTESEKAARQFAHNAVSDYRTDIPVVLHAKTPDRKDIETREQHLYRGGVFPYGDSHSQENEVPIRKGRRISVTGISWRPDVAHPDADENGWIHHTYSDHDQRHHTATVIASGKPPVDWDTVGAHYPHLYGDPEVHGEAAEGADGWGIGEAANHLAHDRAEDPGAESSSVHELDFHPTRNVETQHIDYVRHPPSDHRVAQAIQGYKDYPDKMPPLVLVQRHGIYHVADGHHRAAAAAYARVKPNALVAHSPHADEPFSDGTKGPFHGAEPIGEGARHTAMPRRQYGDATGVAGAHVFRGVHGSDPHAAAEATRQGVAGAGDLGPGVYVAEKPWLAIQHAQAHPGDDTGVVMHGQIHPDAAVAHADWAPHHIVGGQQLNDWARREGHDVLTQGFAGHRFHVVLNPSVIKWDSKNYSPDEAREKFDDTHWQKNADGSYTEPGDKTPEDLYKNSAFSLFEVNAALQATADGPEQDYRMQHQAPDSDYGAPLHDVESMMPDFYTHPHYYDNGQEYQHESTSKIFSARGNPEKKVRIYRALPAEHAGKGFNSGDWVTTSKSYAREHARINADPKHDWPVISTTVPAKHLHTEGDVHEWAYNGPRKEFATVSHPGGYHQEVRQRADGTIAPVKRRPKKEDPLKGFDIQYHQSDIGTDTHQQHAVAYDPEGNFAGKISARPGEDPHAVDIDPNHRHLPLEERMRQELDRGRSKGKHASLLQITAEVDWCAHRHLGSCFWPGDHPAPGTVPQRRGACNWTTPWEQQLCPISDPGPMAGMFVKGARESALLPVEEGGFKGFVEPYEGHFQQSDSMDRRRRAREWAHYDDAPKDHHYPTEQPAPVGSHANLVDFMHDHRSNRELWHQHGEVQDVDLTHGVYATQPYLVREHLQRYRDDPQSMGATQRANSGTQADWLTSYPGTHMPMFVRHQGNTFAIEGHHRVGAALARGEDKIHGTVYDADKHGWQSSYDENDDHRKFQRYGATDGIHCVHEHDNPDEAWAHELYNHDDGICAATGVNDGISAESSIQDPEVRLQFTATWADVRNKAKCIRHEGGVRILMASSEGVVGEVRGDNNIYETSLTYVPGSAKVGYWHCGCAWAAYAWGRSPKYRRFEGRMCSHALAMQFEAASRSAHGREVMPDTQRPDWMQQRTPVVIQHQRDPEIDLTRRAVPPGNMRRVFSMWEAPVGMSAMGLEMELTDGPVHHTAAPDQEFHNTVQRALDRVRDDEAEKHADDATYAENNEPLKKSDIPEEHHGGWRFSQNVEAAPLISNMFAELFGPQKEDQHLPPVSVTQYKHPVNREPLHLDEHGNSYRRHYEWTHPDAVVPEFKGWSGPHSAAETLREHPTWSQSFDGQGNRQHHMRTHEERLQRTGTDPTDSHHDIVMRRNRALGEAGWGVVSAKTAATYYHATPHNLDNISEVAPPSHTGVEPNYDSDESDQDRVFMTHSLAGAHEWGRALGGEHGYHIYEVHPDHEPDEDDDDVYSIEGAVRRGRRIHPQHQVTASAICPECHGSVTPLATSCPHCGASLTPSDTPDAHLGAKQPGLPTVAGVVLKALDTGRILMLQRGMEDEKDPARGTWEFPGGHVEEGDVSTVHAAIREWEEEVGQRFPEGAAVVHTWTSPNGIYAGYVALVPEERVVVMHDGRVVPNPDDPNGDHAEQAAWWTVDHAKKNPALRAEVKSGTPWREIERAGEGIKAARLSGTQDHRLTLGGQDTALNWWPVTADYSSMGPLKEFAPYPAADPPAHSESQNPASTGFATSEDPDSWAEPRSTRDDLRVSGQHHLAVEGYNAWRDRLWGDLRDKGQPVPQTNHLYRAVSDGEMHAARRRGAFHSQDGQGLFVTDDPDRIGRKGGGYSGNGQGGHIIEIDRDKVDVGERPSYYNSRLMETTVDHVPMHAVTRSWSWNDEAQDHLPSDIHRTATLHAANGEYRIDHRPEKGDDGESGAMHRMEDVWGADIYDHPEYFSSNPRSESVRAMRKAKVNPDEPTKIYRALPPQHHSINTGDWVTTSADYAKLHADLVGKGKFHIVHATVPARHLYTDGNDLHEFGYHGPGIERAEAHSPPRLATLHAAPEPALPSTDGEREDPLPPGTSMPSTDAETMRHGYDDLSEFREDHPELGISSESALTLEVPAKMQTGAGSVADIVAAFQRTAGAQALATSTPKEKDGMDIAAAARMHLEATASGDAVQQKTALKSFTFPEQQQLIHEGGDVTARNLDDLKIEGTHYEPLEAALKEQEGNGVDASDLFVL